MIIRRLYPEDLTKDYYNLLNQLSSTEEPFDQNKFVSIFKDITNKFPNQYNYVLVDPESNKIIGTITLLIEQKFLRGGRKIGHIEDVIVDKNYKGQGLGKFLVESIIQECKEHGCYKCILNCSENLEDFYKKCNLKKSNIQMSIYF